MSLTNKQKAMLHTVPADMGVDDEGRRTIQRNIGGFESAADTTASHEGFVAVMAFYEARQGGQLRAHEAGYWHDAHARNERNGGDGTADRIRWLIGQAGKQLDWTIADVNMFLNSKHCSSGRYRDIAEANPYWLRRLLDALDAIARRQARRQCQHQRTQTHC